MGKGRGKHYKQAERLLIIGRYDESKKTVQEFCEQETVNPWTLGMSLFFFKFLYCLIFCRKNN